MPAANWAWGQLRETLKTRHKDVLWEVASKSINEPQQRHGEETTLCTDRTALRPRQESTLKKELAGQPWRKRKRNACKQNSDREKREGDSAPWTLIIFVPEQSPAYLQWGLQLFWVKYIFTTNSWFLAKKPTYHLAFHIVAAYRTRTYQLSQEKALENVSPL